MSLLAFYYNGKEDGYWELSYRSEVLNPFAQKKLSFYHLNRSCRIECLCSSQPVKMHVKEYSGRFYVNSNPGEAEKHDKNCAFHPSRNIFTLDKETGREVITSKSIFTVKLSKEKEAVYSSFRGFCMHVFDEAYAFAFNRLNEGRSRLGGNLKNPSFSFLIWHLEEKFFSHVFEGNKSLKKFFDEKNLTLSVGIVKKYERDEKLGVIKMLDVLEGRWIYVDLRHFYHALEENKIFDHVIKFPYVYFLVRKGKMTWRLVLFPVASVDLPVIVESDLERKFALRNSRFGMFKPVSKRFIPEVFSGRADGISLASLYYKTVGLSARPDFIFFKPGRIEIVEVIDRQNLKNPVYLKNIERKRKIYRRLKEPFAYREEVF